MATLPPVMRAAAIGATTLVLAGCPTDTRRDRPAASATRNAPPPTPEPKKPDPAPTDTRDANRGPDDRPKVEPSDTPAKTRAEVATDVPLPLPTLLGHAPSEVQALLGEPTGKGRTRDSCVRFAPDRQWFQCKWVWQRYADKTGTFKAIQITYEDGTSAAVAFEGLPGEGGFEVDQALRHVGLTLPGTPKEGTPAKDTQAWTWFNDQARLVIDGQQYRVELSVRERSWEHSKLDVILNSPLSVEQQAKKKPTGGKE